ncbi:MAG: serine/threonine protein kinase [Gemmatimonadales bacterium]|nr:MAG: serine/threonine protein kinase [Gemmatimonadales bacterium]
MSDLFRSLQIALADTYQLERELGRGGMATVYLARELKHPRHVAIKVLRPELAGVMTRGRFLREIRISSELAHPHILPLLDSGTVPPSDDFPALPFYTMPFVEGESLRDRLTREQQLPIDDALQIAGEVAAALGYAHTHDVVHRDIKPENILLMDGHAVVADFGIARAIKEAVNPEAVTSAGIVIGTPAYMSPEQAAGKADLDGRSDVYSLGCVLYEMLGGEPPFTGATPQAVLARHRMDHAPSLRTLRTSVPDSIEQAVMRALEKAPADRFATAGQFAEALRHPTSTGDSAPAAPTRTRRRVLVGLAVVLLTLLGWRVVQSRTFTGDPKKVVVFPLGETPAEASPEGTGAVVALMIGTALEYTEPLQWIDGLPRLDPRTRGDAGLLTATEARRITRSAGARWFLDGTVVRRGDSATVVLRLNDAQGDSVVGRASATRAAPEAAQAGLAAVIQLLPRLLAPGQRMPNLSALVDPHPAAVALWLQGEHEYRRSHYTRALEYQRRAVEADSALAFAALKGALAAEWEHRYEEAAELVELALRNENVLPSKYKHFALGLRAYYGGQADTAVKHFQDAIGLDSTWSEAWMALGEVRYHLFTGEETRATEAFARARKADPDFAPPLFHLTQIALRSGDTASAASLIRTFRLTDPDSLWVMQLDLSLTCLQHGPGNTPWQAAAEGYPDEVAQAGKVLASSESSPDCAEAAFRSILAADSAPVGARWGAILGLQGILTARGRLSDVEALLDSTVASGVFAAKGLYVIHAAAGLGMDARAATVIVELGGEYQQMGSGRLWYHGIWLAHRGDRAELAKVARALASLAERGRTRLDISTSNSIAARLALLEADTGRAITLLGGVSPSGDGAHIEWGMQEPFGQEQLLLAELLLARGQAAEAIQVANRLDHPRPIIYLVYLRQSLELRIRAAEALRNPDMATMYRVRLTRL